MAPTEELVAQWTPLVEGIARRFVARSNPIYEDVVSEGMMGLLAAFDRYDPSRGRKFVTFAQRTIWGTISNFMRDRAAMIRIPPSTSISPSAVPCAPFAASIATCSKRIRPGAISSL